MALLETRGLRVDFGGFTAVSDVDLDIEEGTITGLIGPNGAGKTTTFNTISGLQPLDGGRVVFDGRDVTKLSPHRRARLGMSRTFQRLEIFGSLTARENILTAAELSQRWTRGSKHPEAVADQVLEQVGLGGIAHELAGAIPTGQARLVELGRALATNPKILLLDEPASGQDEAETEAFGDLLVELSLAGLTVFLVEHDVPLVMRVCSTVYVLDFGSLIACGTPAEVQRNHAVLDSYLGSMVGEANLDGP